MNQNKIIHKKIKIDKTAHYYTLGRYSETTKFIWLVCHGYGQTADRFISKFDVLDLEQHFVIAPEGLSRFYWNGVTGHVVASWMTRKDRLDEIDDHVRFLHATIEAYLNKNANFIFFGFSQGCATILRYLERFQPVSAHIILWAGSIPKDLDFAKVGHYLRESKIHMVYGEEDQFLTPEVLRTELQFIADQNIDLHRHTYPGTHRVDKKELKKYVDANILDQSV
ncbi:MAG: phospholipase [Saprospiraceae bacterium]|nr:phospholipase [Saprospiraceae bacterium]